MASFAFSTPSPPGRVHTPGTPKHGYADSWDPYSTPRKSARISAQRSNQRTPSPRAATQQRTRITARIPSDPFDTPVASPQKKRQPAMDSVRRASGALAFGGTANAAESLGIGSSRQKPKANTTSQQSSTSAMLPTPAKTPQKQPDEKSKANVRAIARNLFSTENDVIASPKKRKAKKYTGITLDSFTAEDVEEPIEIFTDSRDRVPEVDRAMQNPFYNHHSSSTDSEASKRIRAKQVSIPGEGRQTVDEALQRKDGIIYVFRGKKIFRKFSSDEVEQAEDEDISAESSSAKSSERLRPLTRSSIKPRLLFPSDQKGKGKGKGAAKAIDEDEEAVTDIEDHVFINVDEENEHQDESVETPATPDVVAEKKPETPAAPKFAPASPPSTVRATRASTKLRAAESPMKSTKPRSPFDGWRRSKSRAGPHGQKREGEELIGANPASKRQRA